MTDFDNVLNEKKIQLLNQQESKLKDVIAAKNVLQKVELELNTIKAQLELLDSLLFDTNKIGNDEKTIEKAESDESASSTISQNSKTTRLPSRAIPELLETVHNVLADGKEHHIAEITEKVREVLSKTYGEAGDNVPSSTIRSAIRRENNNIESPRIGFYKKEPLERSDA